MLSALCLVAMRNHAQAQVDPTTAEAGAELFQKLKAKGAAQLLFGSMGSPSWALYIPASEWKKLNKDEKAGLGRYASSMVNRVKAAPEAYAGIPPSAPAFNIAKRNIARMDDGSWSINLSKKTQRGDVTTSCALAGDSAWAAMEGGTAVRWSDFIKGGNTPSAPPKAEPSYNQPSMSSVQNMAEVKSKRWILDKAHDPDSVSIEDRGPFFKTTKGYAQKVKVRGKNAMGGTIMNVFEFHFDNRGNIMDVRQ